MRKTAAIIFFLIFWNSISSQTGGSIQLPELSYSQDALVPIISASTMSFHHGKHHKAYVDNLNKLIGGTDLVGLSLEAIIKKTAEVSEKQSMFNNAAQAWNHTFYWKSLKPNGGGMPSGELAQKIDAAFGSYENFKKEFSSAAVGQFGSGWAWLVMDAGVLCGNMLIISITRTAVQIM
jgi:Fe-Mn family superoxide dismutase